MENPEVVYIDFKGRGIKASINKNDFDPKKHVLWTSELEKKYASKSSEAALPDVSDEAAIIRPPKTKAAK